LNLSGKTGQGRGKEASTPARPPRTKKEAQRIAGLLYFSTQLAKQERDSFLEI